MKKIFLVIALFVSTGFCADYTLSDVNPHYVNLPVYKDGDKVTIRGHVKIFDQMVLEGGAEVHIEPSSTLHFCGINGSYSNLKAIGNNSKKVVFKLLSSGALRSSILIDDRGSAEMKNVVIDGGSLIISKTDKVLMENVILQNSTGIALDFEDASPQLYNCKITNPYLTSFRIRCTNNNFKTPKFYACHFEIGRNTNFRYHASVFASGIDSDKNLLLEGNYWNNILPQVETVTDPTHFNVKVDTYPVLSASAFESSTIYLKGGPGTAGTFNDDFYFFSNHNYRISGGELTVTNGVNIKLGFDRSLTSYSGGTNLAFDTDSTFIFENGSKLISRGTTAKRNIFRGYNDQGVGRWKKFVANAGADIELTNTTIKNATTGIDLFTNLFNPTNLIVEQCSTGVKINNSTLPKLTGFLIKDCTVGIESNNYNNEITLMNLNTNITGILVSTGNVNINNNKIIAGLKGVDTQAAGIIRKNTFEGSKIMIRAENSSFVQILENTFNGANSATGIHVEGNRNLYIYKNIFNDCKFNIINNSIRDLTAENNWFGSNPPQIAKFAGSAAIDCEPWLNVANINGLSVSSPPEKVDVNSIYPANRARLSTAPDKFLFKTTDNAYYGDDHLCYVLMIDDESTFSLPLIIDESSLIGVSFSKHFYKNNEQAQYNVLNPALFDAGKTYYWKVGVKDPWGTDTYVWSDIFSFTVVFPEIDVNVESSTYQASAGEQVNFTISFANNNPVGNATQVHLNHVLPEEVSSNGKISFSSLPASIGLVKINLYGNTQGTLLLHSDNFTANGTVYNYQIPANIAKKVVRYEIILDRLNNGVAGSFAIGSYIK